MVQVLLYMDAFTGRQSNPGTGWDGIGSFVGMNSYIGFVVNFFVGRLL